MDQSEILAAASAQGTITKIDAIMAIGGDSRQVHTAIDALLEQELLFVEAEGRYILTESVRDRISEQTAKTGGNVGDNQDLPTKHQPSTNQAPTKHQPCTNHAPTKHHANTMQVIQALHKNKKEMTRNELQEALKLDNRGHFSREYIIPSIESGLIERTIPTNPRHAKQKYRLTELGRSVAEGMK